MTASTSRILPGAGHADAGMLNSGTCRYCGGPVLPPRRTFCSGRRASIARDGTILVAGDGCVHEHCLRSQPAYARQLVYARDRGKCELCPTVCTRRGWEMDHRVPVVEGGGSCGLENLRTLCRACHRRETAALARRRAERRRQGGAA